MAAADEERALRLDGRDDHAMLRSAQVHVPDGPVTLEAWVRFDRVTGRIGVATKTENSEFGIFVEERLPSFIIHLERLSVLPVWTGTSVCSLAFYPSGFERLSVVLHFTCLDWASVCSH